MIDVTFVGRPRGQQHIQQTQQSITQLSVMLATSAPNISWPCQVLSRLSGGGTSGGMRSASHGGGGDGGGEPGGGLLGGSPGGGREGGDGGGEGGGTEGGG